MEEKKRGGPRLGAGRKPIDNPKVPLTLYIEKAVVEYYGTVQKIRELLYKTLEGQNKVILAPEITTDNTKYQNNVKDAKKWTAAPSGVNVTDLNIGEKTNYTIDTKKAIEAIMKEERPSKMTLAQWATDKRKRIEKLKSN